MIAISCICWIKSEGASIKTKEEDVLAALEKPRALFLLQQLLGGRPGAIGCALARAAQIVDHQSSFAPFPAS